MDLWLNIYFLATSILLFEADTEVLNFFKIDIVLEYKKKVTPEKWFLSVPVLLPLRLKAAACV